MTDDFRRLLNEWYERAARDLPWRRTRDPYAIWVSEIMLQQTRVAAVIPFYERFLERFPTIESLAGARETDILSAWAGLGYYSRVRNMHRAACAMRGVFPANYPEIRALPGIGDYTAAAVASIAFGLPHAAVDGNVLRVLARITNNASDINAPATKKRIACFADRLLDPACPGNFNQAMMELGATVCLPRGPQCLVCPVQSLCEGRKAGMQDRLPVKAGRSRIIRLTRIVYIVERDKSVLFWQRPPGSPKLGGFWELPEPEHLAEPPHGETVGRFRHSITTHSYTFEVRVARDVRCREGLVCSWLTRRQIAGSPISTTARKALHVLTRVHACDVAVKTL
jgi:A/G-specific adenine glycosylase